MPRGEAVRRLWWRRRSEGRRGGGTRRAVDEEPWTRHFLRSCLACGVRRLWWGKDTSGGCGMLGGGGLFMASWGGAEGPWLLLASS